MMNRSLKIGVVGGSISGCSALVQLSRAGHDVTIFERSVGKLVGKGNGIGTPGDVFDKLIEQDIIDADLPHLRCNGMPFTIVDDQHQRFGKTAWRMPMGGGAGASLFHWSGIWESLYKRVPKDRFRSGVNVVDVTSTESQASLRFQDGSTFDCDLAIFADGYQSLGRKFVSPETGLNYRGVILWRGIVPEAKFAASEISVFDKNLFRLFYKDQHPGHLISYLVPGLDGSIEPGQRLINWAAYMVLEKEDLPLIDVDGNECFTSVPAGKMSRDLENRLKDTLVPLVPSFFGEQVRATENTHVQMIFTCDLTSHFKNRVAVIGDAGILVPPFTSSGILKGFNNISDLLSDFENHDNVDDALKAWDKTQLRIGKDLLLLADQTEEHTIRHPIDLTQTTEEETIAWFKNAVTAQNPLKDGDLKREK